MLLISLVTQAKRLSVLCTDGFHISDFEIYNTTYNIHPSQSQRLIATQISYIHIFIFNHPSEDEYQRSHLILLHASFHYTSYKISDSSQI